MRGRGRQGNHSHILLLCILTRSRVNWEADGWRFGMRRRFPIRDVVFFFFSIRSSTPRARSRRSSSLSFTRTWKQKKLSDEAFGARQPQSQLFGGKIENSWRRKEIEKEILVLRGSGGMCKGLGEAMKKKHDKKQRRICFHGTTSDLKSGTASIK